jgi:hypothetical protein
MAAYRSTSTWERVFSCLGWDTGCSCVQTAGRAVGKLGSRCQTARYCQDAIFRIVIPRHITEHVDTWEGNEQVRCRTIYCSFLISHIFLHKSSDRTFINDSASRASRDQINYSYVSLFALHSLFSPFDRNSSSTSPPCCMRLFSRSYRHTHITASTTAVTTPARPTRYLSSSPPSATTAQCSLTRT